MPNVYTSEGDEHLIDTVLKFGLRTPNAPKNRVIKLAIARSLQIPTEPDHAFDRMDKAGKPYDLEQVTGRGVRNEVDYDDAVCALLSCYHGQDLFADDAAYTRLLQRHMRRGFEEIRRSWRQGHDFHAYLYQDLFSGLDTAPEAEEEDSGEQLVRALADIGVAGEIREAVTGPRLTRFKVYLEDVNQHDRLKRGLDKLALSLGLQESGVSLGAGEGPKVVSIDVPRSEENWKRITGDLLRQWLNEAPAGDSLLPVWPGVDVLGQPFSFDLAAAPHLLVAGTTGSGKSVCLHAFILSLMGRLDPKDLKLVLIDPKRVELASYGGAPHLHGDPVHDRAETAVEVLEGLVEEMESRTSALQEAGAVNLEEARRSGKLDLPYVAVFVEELADLFAQTQEVEQSLVRLAQMARAVGIHLVLATQRPDAQTFTGLLRSNIPARIALAVQKASESKIILDEPGAEKLLGKGDMLIRKQAGAEAVRVHGVAVGRDDIAYALRGIGG